MMTMRSETTGCGCVRAMQRVTSAACLGFALAAGGCGSPAPIAPEFALEHEYSVRESQFTNVMEQMTGSTFVSGNHIHTYCGAEVILEAMIEAVSAAQQSVNCETFILESDSMGRKFMEALCERAQAGVDVRLIIDALGSATLDAADIKLMEDAGVRVVRFSPVERALFIVTAGDVNHRTHRKLLIVDGRVGFTGGIGFSDLWLGDGDKAGPWRENGYRVEGPVVAQMQGAFARAWVQLVGEVLDEEQSASADSEIGDSLCQIVTCSPRNELAGIELTCLIAIAAAEESIDIATAYFVPDEMFANTLVDAANRGVKVRILMPGEHTDSQLTRDASRASWQQLLDAHIRVFEYQPAMYHCKVMVVDRLWTAVGSANMDQRSLRLSEEANLHVIDPAFAKEQIALIEQDLQQAQEITRWEHQQRSPLKMLGEFLGSLFGPQI